MARPTINDVARAAGVSKGAVSFALNYRPGLAPETRERILAAARELGWTPSPRARALSVKRALAVGLVVARPPETLRSDAFFPSFIAGLETALSEHGYALMLQVTPEHEEELETYRRVANEGRVDGVLVTDLFLDDPRPALLAELGMPALLVGPALPDTYWPAIGVDDSPGIIAAVEHLVALGHSHIGYVGGTPGMVHARSRRLAWSTALQRAGLPEGPSVDADFSGDGGLGATRMLLDVAEPPTAIVYANDLMAIAGLAVAHELGFDVPRDLSITGYDDIDVSTYVKPPLTTARVDVLGWGRAAAIRLLELIEQRPLTETDLPPPELVVRASTGPAPGPS